MSRIKRYMEELAEKLGKEPDEITDTEMYQDFDMQYQKFKDKKFEDAGMVHKCKCNFCDAILVDTNPQVGAAYYKYNGEFSTESMVDEEGGLIGCPNCKTDAYLMDL